MKKYIGCCVELSGELITDMVDKAKQITYRTFCRYADSNECFPGHAESALPLNKDYAVSFYKSTYNGKPCVFIEHSRIEYVFI